MIIRPVEGKVVVVTGAAGRLGPVLLRVLGREGARLAAFVRSREEAARIHFDPGVEGRAFSGDAASEADMARMFNEAHAAFGRVDAVIHAIGTWRAAPLRDTSLSDWETLLSINLSTAFLAFREGARVMSGGPGRLIAFASGQGADRGRAEQAAYSASKAGVIRLVESVAEELSGSGITAHAIAPSNILYSDEAEGGRGVTAERLADLCIFLCSESGAALNGKTLRAYGEGE